MAESDSASRTAAHDILIAVLDEGRPLDEAFDPAVKALTPRDRAFTRMLTATTLRHLGRIDLILRAYLDKPVPKRANGAKHLMRLASAQLLFLGTPAHAAVATAVEAARRRGLAPYAGLINAVLRKVAKEGPARLKSLDDPMADLPKWLAESWVEAYGKKTAGIIARASAKEAPLDLSSRSNDPAALAELVGGRLFPLAGSVRLPLKAPPVPEIPGFRDGAWWVQDAGAAVPVRLMGYVAGKRVLDLCAAPGGKTLQLAALGAQVTAVDRSDERLKRLRENLNRMDFAGNVAVVTADATSWSPKDENLFDAILLDAPCTATGTLRRHPDIPWIKRPTDAAGLTQVQDAILDNAVALLKPGGTLIYSVCSLQPEEGEPRIEAVLKRHDSLRRDPVKVGEAGLESDHIRPDGSVRLLPCHFAERGGVDGFFVARLVKSAP